MIVTQMRSTVRGDDGEVGDLLYLYGTVQANSSKS